MSLQVLVCQCAGPQGLTRAGSVDP